MSKASTETVKVMVRVRPMNKKELSINCKNIVKIDKQINQIELSKPDDNSCPPKDFAFDSVYDTDAQQQVVYDESAFPLVESVIKGYNGTIFAYGQTGCGKTHTMLGIPSDPVQRGIIPNCFAQIFGFIDEKSNAMKFLVRCSYLEIYNEEIHDLLVDQNQKGAGALERKLELKEDPQKGIFVKDLTCIIVKSIPEIEKAMNFGTNNRKTAATNMNQDSSRSHSIFTIYIETGEDQNGEQRIKAGKLNLVDLAGSERSSKTGATGQTLKEGIKINLSLTALGNVISSLVDGKSQHIPYRDSKLTRLLQDSLGGNTKTVMIAACSPADYNYEETLSTLRYAARAKAIKNKPKVNEDPKDALLKQYEEEIKKLKDMLDRMNSGKGLGQQNVVASLQRWENAENIKIDFERSIGQSSEKNKGKGEDLSVEELIRKLHDRGTKVKILKEDEENIQTPDNQNSQKKSNFKSNKENIPNKKNNHSIDDEYQNQKNKFRNDTSEQIADETTGFQHFDSQKQREIEELQRQKEEILQLKDQHIQQKEQLQNELLSKEQALEIEKSQKEKLFQLITEMEKKLVKGGHGMDDLNEGDKEQIRKERLLQKQLKKQKKKEQALMDEKRKKEEEMLFVQGNYSSLQQEVESMRAIMEKLRNKYKSAESEIADLTHEHQQQKSELLDIIRSQEKAVKFSNKVMSILLSENELYKLHQRSKWDEEKGDWTVPLFTFNPKNKDIQFPSINAKQRVEQSKEEREINIAGGDSEEYMQEQFRKPGNFGNTNQYKQGKTKEKNQKTGENNQAQNQHPVTNYQGLYNHSADEHNSLENNRIGDQSWLDERLSQDNMSNNNLRDSQSNNGNVVQVKAKNANGAVSVNSLANSKSKNNNQIIPERRRKYLTNGSDDQHPVNEGGVVNQNDHEILDDPRTIHKKNNKKNIHLQPLDHNPQARNSSVPPAIPGAGVGNQARHVPSPKQRGGNNIKLQSIDHTQHQINGYGTAMYDNDDNIANKLPSPMAGGRRKQLEPLK